MGGSNASSNEFGITVNLVEKTEREMASQDVVQQVKTDLKAILPAFAKIKVTEVQGGPPSGASEIEVRLTSEDLERLQLLGTQFKEELAALEVKGSKLTNIVDDAGGKVTQMTWTFNRERLQFFGLSPSQVSQSLRAAGQGTTAIFISEGEEELDVEMRFDFEQTRRWDDPTSLDILAQIPIKTPAGNYIKLSDIADPQLSSQRTLIRRLDGDRTMVIGANIEGGTATVTDFGPLVEETLGSLDLLPGENWSLGGDNEEVNRLVGEMAAAMLFAVFLIAVILVLQFDSFSQSLVIVALLPFSLTGVFIGFWLSGTPVSFPAMIGIVALAGIIVNDAIVLIDQINNYARQGLDKMEAIIAGSRDRMQPIFITSVTTILGMLPLAFSDPIWEGLAFAIVYGMTLSTILTLVLVPCMLMISMRIGRFRCRLCEWVSARVPN